MTPPSDWRELSRAEVFQTRFNNAGSLKGSQIMSDYDIYVDILKIPQEKTEEMLARLKIQKLEDLKLQVLAQNPQLLGVGIPGDEEQNKQELGTDPGGPNMMPSPEGMPPEGMPPEGMPPEGMPPEGMPPEGMPPEGMPPEGMPPEGMPPEGMPPEQGAEGKFAKKSSSMIPKPSEEDIKKYDLEISNYSSEQDQESIDYSVGDQ
jgi:hypothetical protein